MSHYHSVQAKNPVKLSNEITIQLPAFSLVKKQADMIKLLEQQVTQFAQAILILEDQIATFERAVAKILT